MKIALGSDHAGFRCKEKVKELLTTLGHEIKDVGTFSEEPVDYPLFIRPVAEAVARGEFERGGQGTWFFDDDRVQPGKRAIRN